MANSSNPNASGGKSPVNDQLTLQSLSVQQEISQFMQLRIGQKGILLPMLHHLQERFGYIDEKMVPEIAAAVNLSRAEVYGVISFYHDFKQYPPKPHRLKLCRAEACQSMGSDDLAQQMEQALDCANTGSTGNLSSSGDCSLETVYCLGLCAMSPAAMIDGQVYGRLTHSSLISHLRAHGISVKGN